MDGRSIRYGRWTISFDPPPIPVRTCDWTFSHENFDASYEGEEDGWVGNGLCGTAASIADAKEQIADIEAEKDMPSTAEAKADATLLAVSNFARCTNHDTRGCACREIASRLIVNAALAEATA